MKSARDGFGDLSFVNGGERKDDDTTPEKRGRRCAWAGGRDRVSDRARAGRTERGRARFDESVVLRASETVVTGDARDREHRSPPPGVPENPTGTRARFGTAGTRVF